jgi:lactoylglutathione lyase
MAVKKRATKASSKNNPSKGAKTAPAKGTTPPRSRRAGAPVRARAEALKMSEASPGLTVNDLEKSLAWYRDVLGFVVEERWEQEGKLMGVSLRTGSVTFMISQDDWKKGRDRKKGEGFRLYCTTTQDVDALAKTIQARGGKLDQEPRDQPWGTRDFALTDPDGFKITIGADTKKR